jgi:hypothetical protein
MSGMTLFTKTTTHFVVPSLFDVTAALQPGYEAQTRLHASHIVGLANYEARRIRPSSAGLVYLSNPTST